MSDQARAINQAYISARRAAARPIRVAILAFAAVLTIVTVIFYVGAPVIAPNVVGSSLEDAAAKLDEAGITVDIDGAHGTVTAQHPSAGEKWYRHQDFVITYTNASGTHTIGG